MKLKLYLTFIVCTISSVVFAQQKTVTGTVVDEDGFPLIGASVLLQGTSFGTSADDNGVFQIEAAPGDVLVVSYVFYTTQNVKIDSRNHYNVVLSSEDELLDDVVVVAYGTATKESITGAVASIGSTQIESRPVSNAVGALEGAAAGIQINNTSGQPGSEPEVRIRGFTTVNGSNSPLYVVDGSPYPGNISDLNPADIESITVLKDASASTLYGNRASNGVIMITTKGGAKGTGFLNVSVKQGIYNRGIKDYDRLGADEFMETMWTGYRNNMLSSDVGQNWTMAQAGEYASNNLIQNILGVNIYNAADTELFDANGQLRPGVQILDGYTDLNWYNPIERTGYRQDYVVNGRVTNDKGGAYFSTGFTNDEGYIERTDYKRFTGRVNADYQAKEWLKVGGSVAGSHQESSLVNGGADNSGGYTNPFMFARNIAPIYSVYQHDANGDFLLDELGNKQYDTGQGGRKQYNDRHVIMENDLNRNRTVRTTLNGHFFADVKFLKDFTFTVKGDMSLRNSENARYENAIVGDGKGNDGRSRRTNYRYKSYTAQQLLNWTKDFGGHHVEALVGHENYSEEYTYMYGMKGKQNMEGQIDWINFNETINLYDYSMVYRTEGFLSRVKYDYNNAYFAEASFRRDGSSKFHKDNRWGNFWSVGGGWIISSEEFFKFDPIDYLKIRASYGEVGNDSGADWYAYQTFYTMSKNGGAGALYKSQNGNNDLQWETSSSLDIGVEARLFRKANIVLEYFHKRSNNLLFDMNLPLSNGATTTGSSASSVLTMNMGNITNKGFELTVDVDIINNDNWKWSVGANATWLKNTVDRLPPENREFGIENGTKLITEGKSIYEFYLYNYIGVDAATGSALYKFNSDKFYVNDSDAAAGKDKVTDQSIIREIDGEYYALNGTYAKKEFAGTAIPDVYGSFSTALSYKNFTLSGLFTYSIGGKTYDYSYASLMSAGSTPSALHKDVLNSYDIENPIDQPILYGGIPSLNFLNSSYNNLSLSDRFLKDASYFVIKNISLNYEMPKSVINKIGVNKFNVNFGIENLATFTKLKGMNPQQSFNGTNQNGFVTPRTFTLGLTLGL
ncbi:SusC/RagA family TonB-linked outer membrane protein [Myroides sp. LJL119]